MRARRQGADGFKGPGYGARAAPRAARRKTRQILDTLIGVVMLNLAARLVAAARSALH